MSKDIIHFKISVPTDQGFLGRECNNPDCQRYFKVHADSLKSEMFCPYCGIQFANDKLWTDDQSKYIREVATEKAREIVHEEIRKTFGKLARQTSGNKFVKITYKSKPYRAKSVSPRYRERQVDSELVCPTCGFSFQVYGIFGYCPGCRNENLLIYDANLEIIRQEVSASRDPQRALRHAYSDLVSAFESFCKRKARLITAETTHFQMLFETRKFFKDQLGIDILDGLDNDDLLALRRVFQKRHAYEHYQGIIEEKYVRMVPEDAHLLNQKAELSLDEFVCASQAMRRALDNLIRAIEKRRL
jgi:DNA-directed RNA polymerase subunit RPC12/RpoP